MDNLDRVVVFSLVGLAVSLASRASELQPSGVGYQGADSISERVDRITHGLVPPLQLAGEPIVGRILAESMAQAGISALALAIVDNCDVVWAGGWGTLEDGQTQITGNTPFQVGSVSKMVTATVAMTMVAADPSGTESQDVPAGQADRYSRWERRGRRTTR